jgi:hypothetical protein
MAPDPDNNPQNWIMVGRVEDKGGWGDDGTDCGGAKDQVGTWGGPKYRLKSNAPDATITFKHLSLREIDPTKSFDDDPTNPPEPPTSTSTIQGFFKFQQDVNTLRTSPCAGVGVGGGGGGETGNTIFYDALPDHDTVLSDSSTFQNRTRVVEICKNSSSVMIGKILRQLDVYLDKVGSPAASPTVNARIWSPGNAIVFTSPTTIAPTTITSSPTFTKYVFDFSANTHAFIVGDRVGVQYLGTSVTDYVECGYEAATTLNTVYANYENGVYDEKDTRDLACVMWE